MSVCNTRFEPVLKFGESVERVAVDISGVRVRSTVRGSASTIDTLTDTSELLTINLEKEAAFHISDGEVTQAGPLNPGETIGAKIAHKVSQDLDARVLAQITNAEQTFDNGDLTTLVSTGTPITLSSTTVPQMVSRMPAKLRRVNNQSLVNMIFVMDSTAASDVTQYLMGKSIDLAGSVFANGYGGDISNAKVIISENLSGEAMLTLATNPTATNTVTINGVVFTFVSTIGTTAGNVLIGADADASRVNLTAAINNPGTTSATQVAVSAADQILLTDTYKIAATNDATANTMTVFGSGSGRLTVAETLADVADVWSGNKIHAYFGKKGGIDLVVQNIKESDMRPTADRRGTNVFSSYLAGTKVFADGAKTFLDVHIAAG